MKKPILLIEKLFKQMIEDMPLDEYMKMSLYKFVKSGMDRTEIIAIITVFQDCGYCLDDFYKNKLAELMSEEVNENAVSDPGNP